MAQTATLYSFEVELAHVDRGVYASLAFRVAQHPSEAADALLTRVLAYCLEYTDGIQFSSQGLSNPDEPPISIRDRDRRAPRLDRHRRARRRAPPQSQQSGAAGRRLHAQGSAAARAPARGRAHPPAGVARDLCRGSRIPCRVGGAAEPPDEVRPLGLRRPDLSRAGRCDADRAVVAVPAVNRA